MFRKTLIARCLTLLVLALLSTNLAWGADVTYKFTPNAATTGSSATAYVTSAYSFTYNEIGWSFNQWNPSTLQIKTNQSSAGSEFNFKNTSAFPGKIKSVVITFKALTVSDASKLCFIGGSSAISSLSGGSAGTWNSTAKTLTWTPDATDNFTYFAFYQNGKAASGTNYLAEEDAIVITYEAGDTPAAELVSIAISGTPTKTTYEAGESFDPAGLVVTGTYDDESQETITSGITWNVTPNPLTAGTTSVSVTATVSEITSTAYQVNGLTVKARTLYSFGFETATSLDWDFENMASMQTHSNVTAHSGSYFGTTGAKSTASMTTKSAVAKPGILTCYVSKQSTNTTSSTWKIQISSDNKSSWTDVKTQDATSMTVGTWVEFTADLSSYKNVYVRIYYTGSTAVRNIDDVSLTLAKDVQSISVMTAPTKTTYNVGENFDPAGLVITATYDDESTEDIAYAGNESNFTFIPDLTTALTTENDKVTITYGEKTVDQAITVSLNKLATPAKLQATDMTPTSATLTWDEVENASSYEVKLNGVAKTATTNSLLVEDLTASTAYIWTVKAIGDGTTYENSEESTANNFTTLALPSDPYTVTFNAGTNGTCSTTELTESSAGAGVTLPEVTPNTGYQFVGWATTNTATEAEYEAGATYYPTEDITLYAVYNEVYTINYMVNGVNTGAQENVVKGTALVFPEVTAPDADHVFCGWVTEAIEGTQATAPEYVNTTGLTASKNITYYAVFAEKSGTGETTYTKLSSNSFETSATYVLAAEESASSSTLHYFSSYTTTTANESWGVTSTTATDAITFTLSGTASALVAQDASGNYLTPLATGKFRMSSTSQTLNLHDDGTIYNPTSGSTGYRLRYNHNNGSGGFRWYNGTTGTSAYFYKAETEIIYSNYCTKVVAKELTSISLSGEYPTEFWKGDAFSHEGMTVTAHYSNAPDADVTSKAEFSTPDMSTVGEQTVTVSYETASTTYDITVKTIANTQETAYTVAEAKAIIDANPAELATTEVYVKGTVSKIVTAYSSDFGNITFDVSADGQTTGNQFQFYRNFKGAENEKWTSAAECPAVGDDVIGIGTMKKYGSTYEFGAGNYLVSHIRVATLSIADITVPLGGEIEPVITTNVPEAIRTISYSVESEDVVKVQDGNLVTVAVGGPVTVTATLTAEGYKNATTTFTVEVIKALESIAVKTAPTTTSYKEGDFFNPAGLVITLTYSDATAEDVEYAGNEDNFTFEPSLETALTTGNTSVTITYAGKEATQAITVRALYTYNITWMANGEEHTTTQVTEGDAVVLPENPFAVGDMTFQGWINTENYYDAETAPEYIVPSGIIPTAAMTFYAVYAKATTEFQEKDVTYTFTSMSWEDATSSWTSGKDGNSYQSNQGVQVTSGVTGANATSNSEFIGVTKAVVNYCTNSKAGKGTIKVKVGDGTAQSYSVSAPSSGGTTLRDTDDMIFENETGNVNITVECTTNSIYINSITITSKVGEETISNFCTTVAPIVISENTVWDGNVTINGNTTVTIGSGAVLTVNGALGNTDPEKLIIKDGGQLVFNDSGKDGNSGVKATVEKNIIPYSSKGDKGWYFLAAPMTDFAVTSFTNQAGNGDYDLYRWYIKDDGTPIWYNYKAHTGEFETNFLSRRGYLAAYETTNLLKMQGTLNAGTTFSFTEELNSKDNFTLLGNPFTYDLNWSDFTMENVYDKGFAVVDSEDGIIEYVADTPIKVGTGFMVYTNGDDAKLSFTKDSRSGKSNDILALNLFASNGNGEDNTIIVIDDNNGGFAKADNFNTNVPQIYTERLQTKYGIRNFSTSTKEFNVSFKAAGEGSNTIRLETIGEFDYVHLYDKLLDVDVDMLLEGSYTFEASDDDNTHRFIVRIDKGNTGIDENESESENFVSVYNGEIHVSGSGKVQIFDVMGRMVHSEVINGDATISTSNIKGGVYVVRLIGDGWTKAEKIVVRR